MVKGPWQCRFVLHVSCSAGLSGTAGDSGRRSSPCSRQGRQREGCCPAQSQVAHSPHTMDCCGPRWLPRVPSVRHQQVLGSQLWVWRPTQRVLLSRPRGSSAVLWWAAQKSSLWPTEVRRKRAVPAGVFPCVFTPNPPPGPNRSRKWGPRALLAPFVGAPQEPLVPRGGGHTVLWRSCGDNGWSGVR